MVVSNIQRSPAETALRHLPLLRPGAVGTGPDLLPILPCIPGRGIRMNPTPWGDGAGFGERNVWKHAVIIHISPAEINRNLEATMNVYTNPYNINPQIEALIDPETGEITDFDQFMALQIAKSEVIDYLIDRIKYNSLMANGIRAEIDTQKKRAENHSNVTDNAKKALSMLLAGEKYESPVGKVTFRKSESVEFTNVDDAVMWLVASGYGAAVTHKETYTPVKDKVKTLLKSGVAVPGAVLEQRINMGVK